MRIQILSGGLANQIRHYVFARFAERLHPEETWFFDDSWFFVFDDLWFAANIDGYSANRPYQLEDVFGLKLNLLSKHFDTDTWKNIVERRKDGASMPQVLLDMGIPITMFEGRMLNVDNPILIVDGRNVGQEPFFGTIIKPDSRHLGFHPEYLDLPFENIYYHADWASKKWFMAYEEENLKELMFPKLSDKRNLEYADLIHNSFSVGIHVRRGDFLLPYIGWVVPNASFRDACKEVLDMHPDAHFFVFSDDLEWCKEHADELGFTLPQHTTYVSGNTGSQSYIDMQLLSMCRGIVRNEESSFSQVAGWLDRHLEFEIKLKNERSV